MKKKTSFPIFPFIIMGVFLMLISGCKKDNNEPVPTTVTDIDGNVYHTVAIGTQVWIVENLKTTKYRNGDPIPNVTDNELWNNLTTGAYSNYDNDVENVNPYGRLYNWYTVADSRNICPTGWHVPTNDEWTTLTTYLGGLSLAGGKLKETGTTHWNSPNTGATNETGFTALPTGYRDANGFFSYIGDYCYWWSTTENIATTVWIRNIDYNNKDVDISDGNKLMGYSVRCVRD